MGKLLGDMALASVVKLNMNAVPTEFIVAKRGYDSGTYKVDASKTYYYGGLTEKRIFLLIKNNYSTMVTGFSEATFEAELDADIQRRLIWAALSRNYAYTSNNTTLTTVSRAKVFSPSQSEITSKFDGLTSATKKTGYSYRTRDTYSSGSVSCTRYFDANGTEQATSSSSALASIGYRFFIILPDYLCVADDGTIFVDSPPAAPIGVTYSTARAGRPMMLTVREG